MVSRTNKAGLSWLVVLSPLSFRVDVSQLHCVVRSSATIMHSLLPTKIKWPGSPHRLGVGRSQELTFAGLETNFRKDT
jgi:hypothetical protein